MLVTWLPVNVDYLWLRYIAYLWHTVAADQIEETAKAWKISYIYNMTMFYEDKESFIIHVCRRSSRSSRGRKKAGIEWDLRPEVLDHLWFFFSHSLEKSPFLRSKASVGYA